MRPVLVVALDKRIEARLLLQHIGGRRLGRFLLERQMHPLVPPILLRVAGLNTFQLNAEPEPPDRQFTEPVEGMPRGEGQAVVPSEKEVMTRQALL